MAASAKQRQRAAEVLRSGGTQQQAADAARVGSVSTIKRWLEQPEFRAMVVGSPEIRPGPPVGTGRRGGVAMERAERLRMWVARTAAGPEVLGSHIPPTAYESPDAVLHVHVVESDSVATVAASLTAQSYPPESHYVAVPLAGLDDLIEDLELVCRLGSSDQRESLMAWLGVWKFVDEDGRTRTLAEALWDGQQRFLEALLSAGHVLSIKSRKVGLSTLVCAHAAWTARIRDRNASVHLLSYRQDAAQELLRSLRRGFEGLPSFLRLPLERETSAVLTFAAGPDDARSLKAFPATPNSAIETTCSHLVLDEWAHTFDPEALWVAVEPTLAPRATSALITTAREAGDFVHRYYLRSEAGETRHVPVFVSALERPDRSEAWLEQKRRQEGKLRSLRNYPLTAEEAFAHANEPYFARELIESAQEHALRQSSGRRGDRYVKAWDLGRKDASVCVVLRAPARDEAESWHVVDYHRLLGHDFPAIQAEIERLHSVYPGPTVIEANSIGLPIIQNLRLSPSDVIPHTTTQASKQAMLTEIELLLQKRTLKVHSRFQQLLSELANYRVPDGSIVQDSVMALGLSVSNRHLATASRSGGRLNVRLFQELNSGILGPPASWLDRQKLTTDGPSWGLVRVRRDVSNPRELSEYQADALTSELAEMLDDGWTVVNPTDLEKLGLGLGPDGQLVDLSSSA
jgi:hypothetical protein